MEHLQDKLVYLRLYRDKVLQHSATGRLVIRAYYGLSGLTYKLFKNSGVLQSLLKRIVSISARWAAYRYKRKQYKAYRQAERYRKAFRKSG
jgi:hypothetical protein